MWFLGFIGCRAELVFFEGGSSPTLSTRAQGLSSRRGLRGDGVLRCHAGSETLLGGSWYLELNQS